MNLSENTQALINKSGIAGTLTTSEATALGSEIIRYLMDAGLSADDSVQLVFAYRSAVWNQGYDCGENRGRNDV